MNEIIIENKPIWDEFKNRLFNIDNQGAFSFANLKIGTEFNCYSCLVSFKNSNPNGVANLNGIDYDGKYKCLEFSIAVDKSDKTTKSIGVNLLDKVDSISKKSPNNKIIAVVKTNNKIREYVAECFYRNGYEGEGILNQNNITQRKKYYKNIFLISDLTLSKNP